MSFCVFDIETGPQPIETLRANAKPFKAAPHPGDFDPSKVKFGQTKDPEKRQAKIAEALEKHATAVEAYAEQCIADENAYWASLLEGAALSALTGQVLAIGYKSKQRLRMDVQSKLIDERKIITEFWKVYSTYSHAGNRMIGFNIEDFDIPFLVQRSILIDVMVPVTLFKQYRYLDGTFIDLRKIWCAGQWRGVGSLDAICRAAGIGAKPEGIDGGQFYELLAKPETRQQAIDYLENDLNMTFALAERMTL
jgi:hypothetical protein